MPFHMTFPATLMSTITMREPVWKAMSSWRLFHTEGVKTSVTSTWWWERTCVNNVINDQHKEE